VDTLVGINPLDKNHQKCPNNLEHFKLIYGYVCWGQASNSPRPIYIDQKLTWISISTGCIKKKGNRTSARYCIWITMRMNEIVSHSERSCFLLLNDIFFMPNG
jgi:hypothetical protein